MDDDEALLNAKPSRKVARLRKEKAVNRLPTEFIVAERHFERWSKLTAYAVVAVFIVLIALLAADMLGVRISPLARAIVALIVGLVVAMISGVLGGQVSAKGSIPLPFLGKSIQFSGVGAVAGFLIGAVLAHLLLRQ